MTAEELRAKRLALRFRSRNALAKALGVSKYAVEHWEYGRRAIHSWVQRFLQCLEHAQLGCPPELKMDYHMAEPSMPALDGRRRVQLELTQEYFAPEVGVAFGTINQWEKGRRRPPPFLLSGSWK